MTDAIAPFHRGGKEQRYLEIARRLAERADVHVYTMRWWDGPRVRRDQSVTYHAICPRLPLYSDGDRRSMRQAIVFAICCLRLLAEPFDVIEADHMPYIQLFTLKVVAKVRRRRLVVTWHECWGPDYWREYLGPSGRVGWWCESLAMRLPDVVIAASPQTAARLREFLGHHARILVAPNGINLQLVDEAEAATDPSDLVVVGRLLSHKRVDLLLDAVAILRDAGRLVTTRVIGNGPQLGELQARVEALGLMDFVDFRQHVDTDQHLYAMLKAARVAVFPSEREGFGIAVLEALACGVPVVTTSAPDNHAQHLVQRSAGGGIVCEPNARALANAISAMLDEADPARPDTRWLAEYNWEAIADSIAAVLS